MTAVYFFAVILGILLVAVLVAPMLESDPSGTAPVSPEERLDAALESLRDLEFDYETGKIEEGDYHALRSAYAAEAIAARDAGASAPEPEGAPGGGAAAACAVCGGKLALAAKFCSRCGAASAERGSPAGPPS